MNEPNLKCTDCGWEGEPQNTRSFPTPQDPFAEFPKCPVCGSGSVVDKNIKSGADYLKEMNDV